MTSPNDAHGPLAGVYRYVPAIGSLRGYRFGHLKADLLAGLTVAAVAVPQAMAYAMVAGVPPEYGLYTAIVMTAVGALFDSSRQLINGPTNAISIAVLSAVAMVPEADRLQAVILLSFLVGLLQLGITTAKLGDLTRLISHSVIIGFTLGAGSLLVLDQMKNLLGLHGMSGVHDPFLVRFWQTMTRGGSPHVPTLLVGLGTIFLVVALRWFKTKIGVKLLPDLLITVAVMAVLSAVLGFESHGIRVIGAIPRKLPSLAMPNLDTPYLRELSGSALAIAILGLLEAISMAKAISAQTRQKIDYNQQCLSEGLANLSGSFFQCIPGSGSLTRSFINRQAGAATQWSGIISAGAVAATVLAFAPYARYIPQACLAGILMISSWYMVDWKRLVYHVRASRFDAVVVGVTAVAAVGISIEFCVLIGVFMSFMLAVSRAGRMLFTEFIVCSDGIVRVRLDGEPLDPRMLIFGFEGDVFFGAASTLERHFETIERRITPETKIVMLRMKRARNADAVGMHMFDEFIARLESRGIHVLLVGVRAELEEALLRTGILSRLPPKHIFREQPVRHTSTQMGMQYASELLGCSLVPDGGHSSDYRI